MGWKMGLEPTTFGTTIRRSNQLSYVHHIKHFLSNAGAKIMPILLLCKYSIKNFTDFLLCNGLMLDYLGRSVAVAILDKLAHRIHTAQVDVAVEQQDICILATL